LYANLIDPGGNVIATVPVSSTGTYSFPNVPQSTSGLTVQLSTNQGTAGLAKPATALPTGWASTGENKNGQGGAADGTANAEIPVTTAVANITLQNFGIQQVPESAVNLQTGQLNPGGTSSVTVPAAAFQTSNVGANPNTQDFNGGTVASIRITAFPANANTITINGVIYINGGTCPGTCTAWPGGGVAIPYTNGVGPAQAISVDPIDGIVNVVIPFSAIDNAGKEDPTPGSVTLPFSSILPLSQLSLTASLNGTAAIANWVTVNEINTAKFIVERSTDNRVFAPVGEKTAAGTYAGTSHYSLADDVSAMTPGSVVYYRIKAVDIDGKYSYSNIAAVRFGIVKGVKAWPNPFTEKIVIAITCDKVTTVQVKITDNAGRVVLMNSYAAVRGSNQFNLGALQQLAKGVYNIEISDREGNSRMTEKLIKE
jgi:hypothetical protein